MASKTGPPPVKAKRRTMRSIVPSAPSVVQQARLLDSAGTAWHAVKYGNLEMITKLFPNQSNVYAKGPVGETVLHMAMLLNTPSTLAIARYLIKLYGKTLVNCPFQERKSTHDPPGAYEGETALHIAIVNQDFDMVKFLVQSGADIRARAYGTFFSADGPMHYGEYPLSFAACTGQKDIVAYLKRHGASVNADHDVHGHTALHMCVFHNQMEMYDFLVEYCAASDQVPDHHGLTPLVLAAQLGKLDMFQHIYSKRRRAFYTFGRVTSYSLALREIDTVQDDDQYVPNALEVVTRKGHKEMLEEPLLANLLKYKWDTFARLCFVAHAVGYMLLEVSQTVLIWLISEPHLWNSGYRASQEYVGFALALALAVLEVMDYVGWSRMAYQRRLCMTVAAPYEPPLYPVPGEAQDISGGRGGLFARLSARIGFPNTRSSLDVQSPRLGRGNSDAAVNAAPVLTSAAPPRRFNSEDGPALHAAYVSSSGGVASSGGGGGGGVALGGAPTLQSQKSLNRLNRPLSIYEGIVPGRGEHVSGGGATRPPGQPLGEGTEGHVAFADEDEGDVVSVGLSEGRIRSMRSANDLRAMRPPSGAADSLPAPTPSGSGDGAERTAAGGSHHGSQPYPGVSGGRSENGGSTSGSAFAVASSAAGVASTSGSGGVPNPGIAAAMQRQRTRARSGGGDTISNAAMLKRKDTLKRGDMDQLLPSGDASAGAGSARPSTTADAGQDMEAGPPAQPSTTAYDAHKTHSQAFFETARDGVLRVMEDPWLFVWHLHLVLTFVHFITWQATYGGVGGSGPASVHVKEFDDVVVSMMGLTGWLAVVYFFRGWEPTGKLAVILERCILDVLRFVSLYVLWNIGFALAFFTLQKGVVYVTNTAPEDGNTSTNPDNGPFATIGGGMMSLIGVLMGSNPFSDYCDLGFTSSEVFCTIYYLLYLASTVLLLLNLLIAMVIKTHSTAQQFAKQSWRARWAIYVLKVERRLPGQWLRTHRLGQLAWDPKTGRPVYSHVFEAVEEDPKEVEEKLVKEQLRAAEGLLEFLKKRSS